MRKDFQNKQVVDLRKPPEKKSAAFAKIFFRFIRNPIFLKILGSAVFLVLVFWFFAKGNFDFSFGRLDGSIYHLPEKRIERGLNLVFYADEYSSWEEFDSDVDAVLRGIKRVEPWKSYERFNVYRINPGKEADLCRVKTENERKPVLRCEEKINRYFEKLNLPQAKFIVFSRNDFQSWANVARLEDAGIFFSLPQKLENATEVSNGYLMAHLLGHAFGLKDEEKYVIAKAQGAPHTPDGPNCAPDKETAQKWWGDLAQKHPDRVGYFKTCAGSEEYIRPTESSLMNFADMEKFIPDYGPVSEMYLRKILEYCFSESMTGSNRDSDFFERYPEFKECLN